MEKRIRLKVQIHHWPSSMWTGVRSLVNTFTSDKYATGAKEDSKTLTIWVNRAITHVDLLQKMEIQSLFHIIRNRPEKILRLRFQQCLMSAN